MTDENTITNGTPASDDAQNPPAAENAEFDNMLEKMGGEVSEENDSPAEEETEDTAEEISEEETEETAEEESEEVAESDEEEVKEEKDVVGEIDDEEGETDLRLMPEKDFQDKTREMVLPTLLKFFRPELLNRFDDLIFFHPLRKEDLKQIVEIMIREPREMLREKNIEIRLSEEAKLFLSDMGYNPAFGARPLRRSIQQYVEDPLSDHLIREDFVSGDTIFIDFADTKDELTFTKDVSDGNAKNLDPFAELDEENINKAIYELDENGEIATDEEGKMIVKKDENGLPVVEMNEDGSVKLDEDGKPMIRTDEEGNPLVVLETEESISEESVSNETTSDEENIFADPEEQAEADSIAAEEMEEKGEKKSFFSKMKEEITG